MKTFKKEVIFIDADNHRAKIDVEITERNGYPEFTASGEYCGSCGQCLDHIKPKTAKQKELIDLWTKHHLKSVSQYHNFDDHVLGILAVIENEEIQAQNDRDHAEENLTEDGKLLKKMEEYDLDENDLDACQAYLEITGEEDLSDFQERFNGHFGSDEEFAKEQAESCGLVNQGASWPNNCIDWEEASKQLMMDYDEQDGFYFRNC